MPRNECQLQCLNQLSEPLGASAVFWQRRNRFKRILKRRWKYLMHWFSEIIGAKSEKSNVMVKNSTARDIQPGDLVRVRSKEEIKATLNRWDQLKGCAFMEEMWPHCGTTHRVLKRVEKFLDERDYLIKRCHGIVILDGVMCQGTKDFGACDRSCFFFWREEWLEKLDECS